MRFGGESTEREGGAAPAGSGASTTAVGASPGGASSGAGGKATRTCEAYVTDPVPHLLHRLELAAGDEFDLVVPDASAIGLWIEGEAIVLDGTQWLGQRWKGNVFQHEWASGDLGESIQKLDIHPTLTWGQTSKFSWSYYELHRPDVEIELVRGVSSSDPEIGMEPIGPVIAPVPAGAICQYGTGEKGCAEVEVRLSSRNTSVAHGIAAGDWDFRMKAKIFKDRKKVDTFLATDEGRFITDLVKDGRVSLFLRGSYLGSSERHSSELSLLCPKLSIRSCALRGNALQWEIELEHFHDDCIWVQLREASSQTALPIQGASWFLASLQPVSGASNSRIFRLEVLQPKMDLALDQLEVRFSLVADDCGALHRGTVYG